MNSYTISCALPTGMYSISSATYCWFISLSSIASYIYCALEGTFTLRLFMSDEYFMPLPDLFPHPNSASLFLSFGISSINERATGLSRCAKRAISNKMFLQPSGFGVLILTSVIICFNASADSCDPSIIIAITAILNCLLSYVLFMWEAIWLIRWS